MVRSGNLEAPVEVEFLPQDVGESPALGWNYTEDGIIIDYADGETETLSSKHDVEMFFNMMGWDINYTLVGDCGLVPNGMMIRESGEVYL